MGYYRRAAATDILAHAFTGLLRNDALRTLVVGKHNYLEHFPQVAYTTARAHP